MKVIILFLITTMLSSCFSSMSRNEAMIELISNVAKTEYDRRNSFCPQAQLVFYDSILNNNQAGSMRMNASYYKAISLLQLGDELKAIDILENLLSETKDSDAQLLSMVRRDVAIAYMRLGERSNCIHNHSAASCIFPIQGTGVHTDQVPSLKAIEIFKLLLRDNPHDLESKWLLNVAAMTIGIYPSQVPAEYLIKGLDSNSNYVIKPFVDVAMTMGLNTKNMAGGSIVEDFNNDGYQDIITSSWDLKEGMHYCRNNGNGTFSDLSVSSGLDALTGGLNMMQTDYNNDGFKDIFVLRGGWKMQYGKEPNSLLKNNGDGTFTDVTVESGLLSFHPTQTATWNDFNNDGWLDVFIGNESAAVDDGNTCELFINNKNGTFTNIATQSNTDIRAYVKGVTSGDYDKDGWVDIFISTMGSTKVLLRNEGFKNGVLHFSNVTQQAGLGSCNVRTFPTFFWDYDNDGWLDLMVCNYHFDKSLAWYAGAEAMGLPSGYAGKQFLFRNKRDGTFEDVSEKVGFNKTAFAMGANFGDIDNDGFLDIYLGTGNPQYQSLIPNKLFKNINGNSFADVTIPAKVGNLQKGHGVSFCDLDNDGDHDIYIDMGGAFAGDAYENSLYINPGQNSNGWIDLQLEGVKCNKAAVGAKIKVTFKERDRLRSVYRDVNSGGSFGANPFIQHIGIGEAKSIEAIEVTWPVSHSVQVFKNIQPGDFALLKEGSEEIKKRTLTKADFTKHKTPIGCSPQ